MSDNEQLKRALQVAEAEAAKAAGLNAEAIAGVEKIMQTITATAGRNRPQSLTTSLAQLEDAKKQFTQAGAQAAAAQQDIKGYLDSMES